MQDDINEIKQDVKEIKGTLTEHAIHLAKYNTLLDIHIKRSELLEERIEPIDEHVKLVTVVLRSIGAITIALTIAYLTRLLLK